MIYGSIHSGNSHKLLSIWGKISHLISLLLTGLFLFFRFFLFTFIYLFIYRGGALCHSLHMDIRGQHEGVGFLLSQSEFQGLNSGNQAYCQITLPDNPFQHSPPSIIFTAT